jgi:hypothetical protein
VGEPHRIPAAELTASAAHRYTPATAGALERMVKLLGQYYPRCTIVECRESLASMYGYDSWSMLETAATRGDPSAYDEDETDDRVTARRDHQTHVALMHCGGVTTEDASAAARIEKGLAAAGGVSISRRHDPFWRRQRVARARYAYNSAYARQAIDEIRPSARDRYAIPADDQGLHMSVRVELLPRALVIWLEHQRPRMGGLADRMAAMRMRQHSQCDLLNFAFVWGEACISHPTDIPEALQLYPLALCAKWYGWNACAGAMPAFPVIQRRLLGQQKVPTAVLALDPTVEHQQILLRAQPREDVAAVSVAVRERQMEAGYALLRPHINDAAASQPMCSFISKPAWIAKAAVVGQAMN